MDTTYRLTQKGSEVQEALNQVTPNTQNIQQLQQEVTAFLNTQQVQGLINAALANYSTTQEVTEAIALALSTALASYSTTSQMNAAISNAISTALTSYSTTQEVTAAINGAITTALASYYTKTEVDNKLAGKQNTLSFDLAPTLNSSNPVTSNGVKVAVDGEATARTTADGQLMTLIQQLQASLLNYYLKTETYNRSEIDQMVAAVGKFQSKIVTTLPTPSIDTTGWIYLIPSDNPKTQNVKEEYITVLDGSTYKWEHIGSTNIDLSGYSTTEQMNAAISTALQAYTTTEALNALLTQKQDTISDLSTIRSGAQAGATAYQKPSGGIPESDMDSAAQAKMDAGATAYQKPSGGIPESDLNSALQQKIDGAEQSSNKVTSLSGSSTDTQYPSAKCTYDLIKALQDVVADIETIAEGYVRVAGSSSPALSYKSYKYHEQGGFGRESAFSLFYPCLVGTKLTGNDAQVGKILHILQKLDYGHDIYGNARLIDGSEGDVMIVNIEPYYRIIGKHTIEGTEYDVFLMSRNPFTWQGIEAERVEKFGWAPDYCVSHEDSDNVVRMHSVYNPDWNGSYSAPDSIVGKYVYSQDAETGVISEEYDADVTVLGGAGGLHTTDVDLPAGEQRAMNQNPDTTKTVPWMNATAAGVENMMALMLAEGGTFDAHNASKMGSGFSSNDKATSASDWDEAGSDAKNGMRVADKDGTLKYYGFDATIQSWLGKSSDFRAPQMLNSLRNPFHIMEAQRAMIHAIKNDVHEMEWFVFEGNKYKWRSVSGFNGPAQGEMTCVLWKVISSKCASNVKDPTDKTTSIEGNRIDFLISIPLFHGMTTQVSPSWWTSGLIFTEDENNNYEAYMERDQESLIKSVNGDKFISDGWDFENQYLHVGSFTSGDGYRKDYSNDALMLPNTNANKTGAGLHTYVGAFNWFSGGAAPSGKKSVRGFRRGYNASNTYLSPLTMSAYHAPSVASAALGFGTCVRIVD